jgi:hypothetical protein
MIGIVKLILNVDSKTHITIKLYEEKIIITIVLNDIKEQIKSLNILKTLILPKCEYFLCLKHWSIAMRNDVVYQVKLLSILRTK